MPWRLTRQSDEATSGIFHRCGDSRAREDKLSEYYGLIATRFHQQKVSGTHIGIIRNISYLAFFEALLGVILGTTALPFWAFLLEGILEQLLPAATVAVSSADAFTMESDEMCGFIVSAPIAQIAKIFSITLVTQQDVMRAGTSVNICMLLIAEIYTRCNAQLA